MFLVRAILFMMSRGQASSVLAAPPTHETKKAAGQGKIAAHKAQTPPIKSHHSLEERQVTSRPHPTEGNITREEMLQLFGNALRVR